MPAISERHASSILTRATGFIDAFDYTLNPYSGCAFGCTYCYAAFFARDAEKLATWGQWVEVKANALDLLRKKRQRPLIDKTIYMSSVTDPYQPVERKLMLTRSILEELLAYHRVRLVIQTRGPLVMRDIDLLQQFAHVQVNMTVTTDDEAVRRLFEPYCASTQQRLDAIRSIVEAKIFARITMTPLLPLRSPLDFAAALRATGVQHFVVQGFHAGKQRFVAGTSDTSLEYAQKMNWNADRYAEVKAVLAANLPHLDEGRAGFIPQWED